MALKHVVEELFNIYRNGPLFPGDTISHATANECVRNGWARRDDKGDFVATDAGETALLKEFSDIRPQKLVGLTDNAEG
ncbi:hypothetical protein LCGC14_0320350 [marine sediment metagenome]|uniref:Uncharacterized protein n=1 Tax=marine sediment metagenome TaxID=412755 RepID=A0A0F9U297_9ZZZZ